MNNYCRQCGQKLEKGVTECPACKTEIIENRIDPEKYIKETEKLKTKEKKYFIISLVLIFFPYVLPLINGLLINFGIYGVYETLEPFLPLLSVAGIITLIYARVKFPKSKKVKGLFSGVIVIGIVYLSISILIFYTCVRICTGA